MRKLFEPRYLERKKIVDKLQNVFEVPLFIVVAAMGYGKTTIVSNFLEKQKEKKVIWHSFGSDEEDDVWIWGRLCEKIRDEGISCYKQLENLGLPKNAQEISFFIQIIRNAFSIPFFIVLDDYHECHSVYWNRLLERLTYKEVPNLHVILIGRMYPEISYNEMSMKGYCILIEQDSFLLTKEETIEFFAINGTSLSEKEKESLYSYTDGWMSAVYLALIDYKKNNHFGNMGNISHLLRISIYDKLSDKMKELYMKMSLFNNFTAEQAIYISGLDISSALLHEWITQTGFIKFDSITGIYTLHALFRSVAMVELEKSGLDKKILFNRCGVWYEEQGDFINAIKYHQKAENTEQIFKIIEREKYFALYEKAPVILATFFRKTDLKIKLSHIHVYLLHLYLLIIKGNSKEDIALFHEAKHYFELEYSGMDKDKIEGELLFIEGILKFNDLEAMTQCIQKAYVLLKNKHSEIFDSQIVFTHGVPEILTLYHNKSGTLKNILRLEKEYTYSYMRFINGIEGGWDQLFEAEYYFTTGNIERAEELAEIACEKAKFRKQICVIISSYFVLLRCDIYLGRKVDFTHRLKELEQAMEGEGRSLLRMDYELTVSYLYACVKQTKNMAEWLQNFQLNECNRFIRSVRITCISYGLLLKEKKQWIQLEALAEEMQVPYSDSTHIYVTINALIYCSLAAYHLYGMDKAVAYLEKGIQLAEPDEIFMPFVENSLELFPVIQKLSNKTTYVKNLILHCEKYKKGVAVFLEENEKSILTKREEAFMDLLEKGYKNAEISKSLNIAIVTVEKTLSHIYRKMNVTNRVTAIQEFHKIKNL